MVNFKKLFTRKRSPFTSNIKNTNTINMTNNPYAYAKKSEYNQSSSLNRAKKISQTYEIGEKVGIRELPSYLPPSERNLYGEGAGTIIEIVTSNNGSIHSYIVRFDTSAGPKELPMYPYMLKKIRQGGGSKRRSRRRTMRRKT